MVGSRGRAAPTSFFAEAMSLKPEPVIMQHTD